MAKKKLDDQQKKCMECQACCKYSLTPINPQRDHLKLLWVKNQPLVYNPEMRYWSLYTDSPCRYLDPEKGCTVYDKPELKPEICGSYMCAQKDKSHMEWVSSAIAESRLILNKMFGE